MRRQKDSDKIMVVDRRWCAETEGSAKVVFRDKGDERLCVETMVVFGGVRSTPFIYCKFDTFRYLIIFCFLIIFVK